MFPQVLISQRLTSNLKEVGNRSPSGFLTNTAIADLPLFPAGNRFPNQSETQIAQSNLIHCCLSATQLWVKTLRRKAFTYGCLPSNDQSTE
ncbi:MAG: hypothetical protein LBG58_07520 [Planctomycetaceae bacterium]|nr:hypothetical protein [Planctomycetaceae bacterium]